MVTRLHTFMIVLKLLASGGCAAIGHWRRRRVRRVGAGQQRSAQCRGGTGATGHWWVPGGRWIAFRIREHAVAGGPPPANEDDSAKPSVGWPGGLLLAPKPSLPNRTR